MFSKSVMAWLTVSLHWKKTCDGQMVTAAGVRNERAAGLVKYSEK